MKKRLFLWVLAALLVAGTCYATTYTSFVDGTYKNPLTKVNADRLYIMRGKVDFGFRSLDAGSGDVAQALDIPAGAYVLKVWVVTLVGVGQSGHTLTASPDASIDLGYGGDVDYWGDGLKIVTADSVHVAATLTSDQSSIPLYFSSGDTIDVKATTDGADVNLSKGVIEVCALVFIP